ncbi:pilus assembly protein TadG-related protein [Actinokineospora pegani]|uniref:pilus assembly protein TadG-related protein n=1 Tax=Actinokineospora pegani TaxID=2654637 RepID=UPI0012EAA039|nr:hypothetical protein [Actinokineospora pegani]
MTQLANDRGSVTAFVTALTAALLVVTGLVLDGGLALAATVRANGQAEAAARAGAQKLDLAGFRATGTLHLVPADAVAAARTYLATEGLTGTATATSGGVTVVVTATHPTQLLGLVGISSLHVHGEATAQPRQG